jgi:hypothetical protein
MTIDIAAKVGSRKFWVTVVVLAGVFWSMRWWLNLLADMVKAKAIDGVIFGQTTDWTVTVGAAITVVIVGLWFGVDLSQTIARLKDGGER